VLYERPRNLFVAEFIGSPAMNLVLADLAADDGALSASVGGHRVRLPESTAARHPGLEGFVGRQVVLGIRPEDMEDASLVTRDTSDRLLSVVCDIREDMGSEVYVHFGSGGRPVRGEDVAAAIGEEAIEATEEQAKGKGSLFVARVGRTSRAREGEQVDLLVTTRRLHFFDPETGLGIYDGTEGAG
jgi:multiple sugar transport system ATP-binding protein